MIQTYTVAVSMKMAQKVVSHVWLQTLQISMLGRPIKWSPHMALVLECTVCTMHAVQCNFQQYA